MKYSRLNLLWLGFLLIAISACSSLNKGSTVYIIDLSPFSESVNQEEAIQAYMVAVQERFQLDNEYELLSLKPTTQPWQVEGIVSPGSTSKKVRQLFISRGKLSFRETLPFGEGVAILQSINQKMLTLPEWAVPDPDSSEVEKSGTKSWLDEYGEDSPEENLAVFQAENPLFTQFSPFPYPADSMSPLMGMATLDEIKEMAQIFATPELQELIPEGVDFLWEAQPQPGTLEQNEPELFGLIATLEAPADIQITNKHVLKAQMDFGMVNDPIINLEFDMDGTYAWKVLTRQNIHKNIAIVVDGRVHSYPRVMGQINEGRVQISGQFTIEEAQNLAHILKAPPLPEVLASVGSQNTLSEEK